MRSEDMEDAQRLVARLLDQVDRGSLEAPPKLLRLLEATQTALSEQLRDPDPEGSDGGSRRSRPKWLSGVGSWLSSTRTWPRGGRSIAAPAWTEPSEPLKGGQLRPRPWSWRSWIGSLGR